MIKPVSKTNLAEALPLIRAYQTFYNVADICDTRNGEFFGQFGEQSPAGCQFLFYQDGTAVAFATVYFTYTSTIAAKVAVLNDLYTLPDYRGKGIGKKLIEHCRDYAINQGAARLQWVTAPDNLAAQKLYDSLEAKKSEWLFYSY